MINQEWRNRNALRGYPFKEGASRTSDGGRTLPNEFLVDLSCLFQKSTDERFYLSQMVIAGNLTITLTFSGDPSGAEVARVDIPLDQHIPGISLEVTGSGLATTGRVVLGEGIPEVLSFGAGIHTFTVDAGELEGSAIVPVDMGVVTSLGILGRRDYLIGDVKLLLKRVITGEAIPANNSIELNAIKRSEDCDKQSDFLNCPIKLINGQAPNAYGNITVTAEDILLVRAGTPSGEGGTSSPGIIFSTILHQPQLCPRPFLPGLRGADGADGAPGGSGGGGGGGGGGFILICSGKRCCPCCDPTGHSDEPFKRPRLLLAIPVPVSEGATISIVGIDFRQPNPNGPGFVDMVTSCVFYDFGGSPITVPIVIISNSLVTCTVPVGLTTPTPTAGNIYNLKLNTIPLVINNLPVTFTNTIQATVPFAGSGSTQIENFDPASLAAWTEIRGPFLFAAPQQAEGTGAFNVTGISPFSLMVSGGPLSGAGAPPWDFSGYSTITIKYTKEFDPLEGGPADFVKMELYDSLANVTLIFVGVLPAFRNPAPHVLIPSDFKLMTFPLPLGPANLSDIVFMTIATFDFATSIPLNAYYDDMQGNV